jgi:hypothetical protein
MKTAALRGRFAWQKRSDAKDGGLRDDRTPVLITAQLPLSSGKPPARMKPQF